MTLAPNKIQILDKPLDEETIRNMVIGGHIMEYINDGCTHVYKFTKGELSFEDNVFKLISLKDLDGLKLYINSHEAPGRWRSPYKSMYGYALDTKDDDFTSSLISSVSLNCDINSGWTDIWHSLAEKCLELNMPKSFTAMCKGQKFCKTELSKLKYTLLRFMVNYTNEPGMVNYSDIINDIKPNLEHDCIKTDCELEF